MTNNLEKELYTKYPKIFRQHTLPMTETCLCWGLECGNGWFFLIDKLCQEIQTYIDVNNKRQVEAVQVKEKFGGLRFYVDGSDEYVESLISEAENQSYNICEVCGTTEKVGITSGWLSTLCEKCAKIQNKLNVWKQN